MRERRQQLLKKLTPLGDKSPDEVYIPYYNPDTNKIGFQQEPGKKPIRSAFILQMTLINRCNN
jgi:hypothetical protein